MFTSVASINQILGSWRTWVPAWNASPNPTLDVFVASATRLQPKERTGHGLTGCDPASYASIVLTNHTQENVLPCGDIRYFSVATRILFAWFFLLVGNSAHAGSISIEHWRGRDVLRLSGPIDAGLADELHAKEELAELWPHGARVLLLDSPGGSVAEAFRISAILDKSPFHTVVPNQAKCASACASIIFIAGKFRTVEPFGAFGQHSCSRNGIQDRECNEVLSNNALAHGVSHGSVAAFLTYASPKDMVWFSREDTDGWGISRYPGEKASGFEKSEPRVLQIITGKKPSAQSAWRLDFMNNGYRAFLRPAADDERELQMNVFCFEPLPGRLFLSMEINGAAETVTNAILNVEVATEAFEWKIGSPLIMQSDPQVASVVVEVPQPKIKAFLTKSDSLKFTIDLRQPYDPIIATTYLAGSRKNLTFAANNCATAEYDLLGDPT